MELASAEQTPGQPATSVSSEPAAETSPQAQQPVSESPAGAGESTTAAQPAAAAARRRMRRLLPTNRITSRPLSKRARPRSPLWKQRLPKSRPCFLVEEECGLSLGLLLAALVLLASVIVPVVRRHALNVPRHLRLDPPSGATAAPATVLKPRMAPAQTSRAQGNGFVGGPRQVSIQLKPWKASLRQTVVSPVRSSSALDRLKEQRAKTSHVPARPEPDREFAPIAESDFESSVGPVLEQAPETVQPAAPSEVAETMSEAPETITAPATNEFAEVSADATPNEIFDRAEQATVMSESQKRRINFPEIRKKRNQH